MKKLLTILSALFLIMSAVCSCSKENASKQYTFQNTYSVISNPEVYFFEYNDAGDKLASQTLEKAELNQVYSFTAGEGVTKVKVYMKYSFTPFTSTHNEWIQQVFVLGSNPMSIVVTGETIVGNSEP